MQDPRISKSYGLARFQPPSGRAALAALRDPDVSEWGDDIMKEVLTSNPPAAPRTTPPKTTPTDLSMDKNPAPPTNRFFGRFMGASNYTQKRFDPPKEESPAPKPTIEVKADFPPVAVRPAESSPIEAKRSQEPATWSLPRSRFYSQPVIDEPPQRATPEPKKPSGLVEAMVADIATSPWLQDEPYRSLFTRVMYALQKKPYPKEYVPFFNEEPYVTSDSFCKFEGSDVHLQVGLAGLIKTSPLVYPFGRIPADAVGSFSDQDITLTYTLPSGSTALLGTRLMRHDGVYVLVPNVAHKFSEIHLPTTFSYRGPLQR